MKGLSPDFTQSHCPRIWQNAFYVKHWKDFWKYVDTTRQIEEWSLDSFHVWVQLRRFNDNSMVKSFLNSVDRWMIPDYKTCDRSWIRILVSIFDRVNTVQDSIDEQFSTRMKRAIYNVLVNDEQM